MGEFKPNLKCLSFIKNKYFNRAYLLEALVYLIAYYYVVYASINDGFSGFLLGIPYVIFLFLEVKNKYKESIVVYLHIVILLFFFSMIIVDRSDSKFFYPLVKKTYTINKDLNYSYSYHKNDIKLMTYQYKKDKNKKQIFLLKRNDKFTIKKQILTGHPDFTPRYKFEIESEAFLPFKKYIQSIKTKYFFNDNTKLYISRYDLQDLMEIQKIPYIEKDFFNRENIFVYFSFYIFIYPIIFLIFMLLNGYRSKLKEKL